MKKLTAAVLTGRPPDFLATPLLVASFDKFVLYKQLEV